MSRSTSRAALLAGAMVVASQSVASPQSSTAASSADPAVKAYLAFVEGKNLNSPANRENIVAALDLLASAIEGLASMRGDVFKDAELARIHKLRRDIRRLASPGDSQALTTERAAVFVTTAQLLRILDRVAGAKADKALIDAVHIAAEGLDREYPLRFQPDALENFFGFTAKALRQIDHR